MCRPVTVAAAVEGVIQMSVVGCQLKEVLVVGTIVWCDAPPSMRSQISSQA